ncbi:hypothetical protein Clacol_008982 [Clathrus columnatus]|uniref:Uncharacterized protein n=1 Tax=Clathrus columnatus TaxID=1419009 RepID=A0AAV5AJZ8_9AGAM|nr:hypothetical protein Clacol_008982 [Clathrus columnatus]
MTRDQNAMEFSITPNAVKPSNGTIMLDNIRLKHPSISECDKPRVHPRRAIRILIGARGLVSLSNLWSNIAIKWQVPKPQVFAE